jgi:hypothetical protein
MDELVAKGSRVGDLPPGVHNAIKCMHAVDGEPLRFSPKRAGRSWIDNGAGRPTGLGSVIVVQISDSSQGTERVQLLAPSHTIYSGGW